MIDMQRILFSYLFIILTLSTYAQQFSKEDERFVDSIMNGNYKSNEPGAVLLIAKNGQPVFRKAYGLASVELNIPNKPEFVFHIGSMSKQFTAVCILKLGQEGKLSLQDEITKYLPDFNTHGRKITIENLLTHTSGFIDAQEKKDWIGSKRIDQSRDDLLNTFMNDSLLFEPGTDWHYSNSNYMVAGWIVEKISGLSLHEYLQQNILTPLAMSHTFTGNDESIFVNVVNGYDREAGKTRPTRYMSSTWYYGNGQMLSNVDDLLKWDNALYTDNVIKKEWLEKAWKPFVLKNEQATNYGFGWSNNIFNGLQIIEHGGGVNGFVSDGIRIPSQQLYVVMLANTTSVWSVPITSAIALHITGQTLKKPKFINVDKKDLESYTGVYALHRAGGNTHADTANGEIYNYITIKGDTLYIQLPKFSKWPLFSISKDLFTAAFGNSYYQFNRNEKGKVISLELYDQPVQYGPSQRRLKTDLSLPKEKHFIILDAKKLDPLKGKYDFGGGGIAPVIIEGNKIYMQMEEKFELLPEDETHFFFRDIDGTIEFIKKDGKITGVVVTRGAKFEAKKIE
jgi:CubicO group peptidase (beta-lactamase class C family)